LTLAIDTHGLVYAGVTAVNPFAQPRSPPLEDALQP